MLSRFDPTRAPSVAAYAALFGVLAGLAAATFLTVAAEPSIEASIRIEQAHAAPDQDEDEVVPRDVQRGPGLFAAYALTGAAFGVLLAVTFLLLRRGRPDVFRRSLVAGALLAGTLTVSPWLKYPPNPPAVGDPDTLGRRQALYVATVVLTAAVVAAAAWLSGRLRAEGWPEARRVVAVAAAVALPLLVAYAALPPAPDAVTVPATLVWRFRLASLGGNLVLWAVLMLGFGLAASESERRGRPQSAVGVPA